MLRFIETNPYHILKSKPALNPILSLLSPGTYCIKKGNVISHKGAES